MHTAIIAIQLPRGQPGWTQVAYTFSQKEEDTRAPCSLMLFGECGASYRSSPTQRMKSTSP